MGAFCISVGTAKAAKHAASIGKSIVMLDVISVAGIARWLAFAS
jgi:hypothetical protein